MSMSKRLYLRGLPSTVGEEDILKFLSANRYGPIQEVKFVRNFVFIEFAEQEDASRALQTFRSEDFLGQPIVIEACYPRNHNKPIMDGFQAVPMRGRSPSLEVFVTNIPGNVQWQELKDFGRLSGGRVTFCDVVKPRCGKGFIAYATPKEADEAAQRLDGCSLGGKIVNVTLRTHLPHTAEQHRERRGDVVGDSDSSTSSRNDVRHNDYPRRFGTNTQSRSPPLADYFDDNRKARRRHLDELFDYDRIYSSYPRYEGYYRSYYHSEDDLAPWRGDNYRPLDSWRADTYRYSHEYSPYDSDSRRTSYEWY